MDSTPLRRLCQNSSIFLAPGTRQAIPIMAISKPVEPTASTESFTVSFSVRESLPLQPLPGDANFIIDPVLTAILTLFNELSRSLA